MANSSDDSRRLEIRSELIRHLETAEKMANEGVISSDGKAATIRLHIHMLDRSQVPLELNEHRVRYWDEVLKMSNKDI
jgi:hypothetical protein